MVADRMVLGLGAFKVLIGLLYLICTIVYNVEIGAPSALTFVGCIPVSASLFSLDLSSFYCFFFSLF